MKYLSSNYNDLNHDIDNWDSDDWDSDPSPLFETGQAVLILSDVKGQKPKIGIIQSIEYSLSRSEDLIEGYCSIMYEVLLNQDGIRETRFISEKELELYINEDIYAKISGLYVEERGSVYRHGGNNTEEISLPTDTFFSTLSSPSIQSLYYVLDISLYKDYCSKNLVKPNE